MTQAQAQVLTREKKACYHIVFDTVLKTVHLKLDKVIEVLN